MSNAEGRLTNDGNRFAQSFEFPDIKSKKVLNSTFNNRHLSFICALTTSDSRLAPSSSSATSK